MVKLFVFDDGSVLFVELGVVLFYFVDCCFGVGFGVVFDDLLCGCFFQWMFFILICFELVMVEKFIGVFGNLVVFGWGNIVCVQCVFV